MKSTTTLEKWASGNVHLRIYAHESIAGYRMTVKIDTRVLAPYVSILLASEPWRKIRYPESKLNDLQEFLEIEGITTCYYAEQIVKQIRKDITKIS